MNDDQRDAERYRAMRFYHLLHFDADDEGDAAEAFDKAAEQAVETFRALKS